jgi:hypothetical protein
MNAVVFGLKNASIGLLLKESQETIDILTTKGTPNMLN